MTQRVIVCDYSVRTALGQHHLYLLDAQQHATEGSAGIGRMFPHWLGETDLFLDWRCWYEPSCIQASQEGVEGLELSWGWGLTTPSWAVWHEGNFREVINQWKMRPYLAPGETRHYSMWHQTPRTPIRSHGLPILEEESRPCWFPCFLADVSYPNKG